ncbi:MAG TPA: hypothetical protein VII12_13870 [Thermoanaerobaculia bacterium]
MATEALIHGILQKTMNDDDISTGELLAASHLVLDELAMVADELQVEVLHISAGAAFAGCVCIPGVPCSCRRRRSPG